MSDVRKFRVKSRLSTLIRESPGMTVGAAIKRANEAIDAVRPVYLENIDATLAEIYARFGGAAPEPESFEDLYLLASRIIDVAICLDGSGIDLAARALCELVDLSEHAGVRDWEAIQIHIDALRVLRAGGLAMSDDQRDFVLEGLRKVTRKRVGDPEAMAAKQ